MPINRRRLATVMRHRGISQYELGRRLGKGWQQNVSNLVREKRAVAGRSPVRTQRWRARAIANELGVSLGYLTGEQRHLSGAAYSRSPELTQQFIKTGIDKFLEDPDEPTLLQFVQSEFRPLLDRAMRREYPSRASVAESLGSRRSADGAGLVLGFLEGLIDPQWWRDLLFEPTELTEEEFYGPSRRPTITAEDEAAAEALAKGFRHVLGPWFRGRSRLDAKRILQFAAPFWWRETMAVSESDRKRPRKRR